MSRMVLLRPRPLPCLTEDECVGRVFERPILLVFEPISTLISLVWAGGVGRYLYSSSKLRFDIDLCVTQ